MPRKRVETTFDVVQMYKDGMGVPAIEEATGVSSTTIYRRLGVAGAERCKAVEVPIADLAAMYESGLTTTKIAENTGLSIHAVSNRLKKAGVILRAPGTPLPRETQAFKDMVTEMIRLYETGLSAEAVAAAFGYEATVVFSRFREIGHKSRPVGREGGKPRPETHIVPTEELTDLYDKGLTCEEVAGATGMSQPGVHHRLQNAGHPMRPAANVAKLKQPKLGWNTRETLKRLKLEHLAAVASKPVNSVMSYFDKYDIDHDEVAHAHAKRKSVRGLAKDLGVPYRQIEASLRVSGVDWQKDGRAPNHFIRTPEYVAYMDGLMLGDGCLSLSGRMRTPTYIMGQCLAQEGWVEQIGYALSRLGITAKNKNYFTVARTTSQDYLG